MKNLLSSFKAVPYAFLITVIALLSAAELHAAAYSGGSGTQSDPYLIADKNDLLTLCEQTNDYDKYFALTADIDLTGEVFNRAPIASNAAAGQTFSGIPFSGVFDGCGHVISNLQISVTASQEAFLGLFGRIEGTGCRIMRLGLASVSIGGSATPYGYVGALCGYNSGASVSECAVRDISISGLYYIGGFCGSNSGGVITDSFATGDVTGNNYIGGFCAQNTDAGVISNCYAVCAVTGSPRNIVSSFCRLNTDSFISACFWNSDICSLPSAAGALGKTTAEMQTQSTFTAAGWDFTTLWRMDGYPVPVVYSAVQGLPFNQWIALEGVPIAMRGETDTPAGDSIPNLLKYAVGLDAMQSYTSEALYPDAAVSNGEFVVQYNKAMDVRDVIIEPTYCERLDGAWSVQGMDRELLHADGIYETWQASVPLLTQGFVRLRAVRLKPVQAFSPPDFGSIPFEGQTTLEWINAPGELADVSYELHFGSSPDELVQTARFENVTALATVTASIPLTEPGNYFWRVDMVVSNDSGGSMYRGELQHFVALEPLSPQLEVNTESLAYYRWFDSSASQENSLKVDLLRGMAVDIGPFNIVSNGTGDITASVIDGSVPAGTSLVITNNQLYLSGVPNQTGNGSLTIQLEKPAYDLPGSLLHIEYDIEPLPAKLVGTHQGFAWQDVEYNCDAGFCQSAAMPCAVEVVIDENGGVDGTMEFYDKTYTFDFEGFDSRLYYESGLFQREIEIVTTNATTGTPETLIYKVSVDWFGCEQNDFGRGTPALSVYVEHWFEEWDEEWQDWFFDFFTAYGTAHRDIWEDDQRVTDSRDLEIFDALCGYYTLSFEGDDYYATNYDSWGNGYLTITVDSDAAVNISGRLGDGYVIDASAPLIVNNPCDDTLAFAEFMIKPAAYAGGCVYMQLHFVEIDNRIFVEVRDSSWVNMGPQANGFYGEGFKRSFNGITGGRYDNTLNLNELFPDQDGFSIRYPAYGTNLVEISVVQDGFSFDTAAHPEIDLQVDLSTGVITVDDNGDAGYGVLTPWFRYLPGREDIAARAYTLRMADNFIVYEDDPSYQYEKSSAWLLLLTE